MSLTLFDSIPSWQLFIFVAILIIFAIVLKDQSMKSTPSESKLCKLSDAYSQVVYDYNNLVNEINPFQMEMVQQGIPKSFENEFMLITSNIKNICKEFLFYNERFPEVMEGADVVRAEQYVSKGKKLNKKLAGTLDRLKALKKKISESDSKELSTVTVTTAKSVSQNFFSGCNTRESLEKRYKDLVKVYHPDAGNGDQETFIEIKKDYEKLKKELERTT